MYKYQIFKLRSEIQQNYCWWNEAITAAPLDFISQVKNLQFYRIKTFRSILATHDTYIMTS